MRVQRAKIARPTYSTAGVARMHAALQKNVLLLSGRPQPRHGVNVTPRARS
jgi:hypothetical protein